MVEESKARKIDKGCSVLNAADEVANPYGLVLSERERDVIYRGLTRLDNRTDAILNGREGWRPQAKAMLSTAMDIGFVSLLAIGLHYLFDASYEGVLIAGLVFLVIQKLNLLLTRETIDDTHARQVRAQQKEAKERAQYFKDMGIKDLRLEE
jgi:hypothetical protein